MSELHRAAFPRLVPVHAITRSHSLALGPAVHGHHIPRARGACLMEHLRVATYEIKTGNFQEIAEKARDGMLKTFKDQPGFLRYGLADIGNRKALSISFWNTHKRSEEHTSE